MRDMFDALIEGLFWMCYILYVPMSVLLLVLVTVFN